MFIQLTSLKKPGSGSLFEMLGHIYFMIFNRLLRKLASYRKDCFAEYYKKTFNAEMIVGQKSDGTLVRFKNLPSNLRSLTFTTALFEWRSEKMKSIPPFPLWVKKILAVWKYGYSMLDA